MLTVWSSTGRIVEVKTRTEALALVKKWVDEYSEQKVVLSYEHDGEQFDEVIYDGIDHERAKFFLEMNRK